MGSGFDSPARYVDDFQKQYEADCRAVEKEWEEIGKPLYESLLIQFPIDWEGK